MKTLIVILILTLTSCQGVGQWKPSEQNPDTHGDKNRIITNDPTAVNIIAYTAGGSVLLATLSQVWYQRKRIKAIK